MKTVIEAMLVFGITFTSIGTLWALLESLDPAYYKWIVAGAVITFDAVMLKLWSRSHEAR